MIIEINDQYRITSDERQFILQKFSGIAKKDSKNGVKAGDKIWQAQTYHTTIPGLIRELVLRDFRGGGNETLTDALERAENLITDACKALKPLIDMKPARI